MGSRNRWGEAAAIAAAIAVLLCQSVDAQFAPTRLMHIRAHPAKARVFVNGLERGYTPLDDSLALGIGDKIQAYAYGFDPWVKTLTAPPDSDTLSIGLTRQVTRLVVQSVQLSGLGAEIKAYFVDQDTVFSGFINISRGSISFESDVFMGRYRLEVSKQGYKRFAQDLFVPEQGKVVNVDLVRHPLPLTAIDVGELREIAEGYRTDCVLVLTSGLAIGDGVLNVEGDADIRISDDRMTPFLDALEAYAAHIQELELMMSRAGEKDLLVLRALAQAYAYRGILLGKCRRFSEAHQLFRAAREISPFPVDQEPGPFPAMGSLGELMRYAEAWYGRLSRLDVVVNPRWTANKALSVIPLRFERVLLSREAVAPAPASVAEQAMHDSLVVLAERMLSENIRRHMNEFPLLLPKGYYLLQDAKGMAVPVYFLLDDPALVRVDPRVDVWLPEVETPADTVRICAIVGDEPGPVVDAKQVAFGQEYELVVDTRRLKRRQERIVFFQSSFARPVWPGVTAIAAESGGTCTYFKEGSNKLQKRARRGGLLKYMLIPIGAAGLAFLL